MLVISLLQFATAVIKPDGTVVGHVPKHASKGVLFFLRKAGSAGFCEQRQSWGRPCTGNSVQLQFLLMSG